MRVTKRMHLILIIGIALTTLAIMIISPAATINPSEVGFWTAVIGGILTYFLIYIGFTKLLKKQ